jgi:ribose-phosphate pyrophosphokinase
MKLFAGRSNPELAERLAEQLNVLLSKVDVFEFADGDTGIDVQDDILNEDVFFLQTLSKPVNDHLMEILLFADAMKRGGAASVTAVVPWLAYSRKERRDHRRDPIAARLVSDLLQTAGVQRLITLDLHTTAIEGFFNIPVINCSAVDLFSEEVRRLGREDVVVVSPDMGGAKRARQLAALLEAQVVILEKYRPLHHPDVEVLTVIGDVTDKDAVIVDDIVSTGGTLTNAAEVLKKRGAKTVDVCVSHAVFAGDAADRLSRISIDKFFVTDSFPISISKQFEQMEILSIAGLLAREIRSFLH